MKLAPRILLACRQGDGLTHIGCVEDVDARLQLLTAYGIEITATWWTERSPHALEITRDLKRRFSLAGLEPGGPWFAVEYPTVLAALAEYDMATGLRTGNGAVKVGEPVRVAGAGLGIVTGFTLCGRVRVSIDRYARIAMTVLAPPSLVERLA